MQAIAALAFVIFWMVVMACWEDQTFGPRHRPPPTKRRR